jgi:hypothetical protein
MFVFLLHGILTSLCKLKAQLEMGVPVLRQQINVLRRQAPRTGADV